MTGMSRRSVNNSLLSPSVENHSLFAQNFVALTVHIEVGGVGGGPFPAQMISTGFHAWKFSSQLALTRSLHVSRIVVLSSADKEGMREWVSGWA